MVERLEDDNPLAYLRAILASPVACVAPSTKERPDRSTRTQSSFKAKRTFSSGVRRSKKAVSLVSEQRVSPAWHRKRQRMPLAVIEVEMALTLLRFIRLGRRIFQTETLPNGRVDGKNLIAEIKDDFLRLRGKGGGERLTITWEEVAERAHRVGLVVQSL